MLSKFSIFSSLKGTWLLNRTISRFGKMEGTAFFKLEGNNTLHYSEKGTLEMSDGSQHDFYQKYTYKYDEKEDNISVYFVENDGQSNRLFHTLKFNEQDSSHSTATGDHICDKDSYLARYSFINHENFRLVYDVEGPEKKYVSDTTFERIPSCSY